MDVGYVSNRWPTREEDKAPPPPPNSSRRRNVKGQSSHRTKPPPMPLKSSPQKKKERAERESRIKENKRRQQQEQNVLRAKLEEKRQATERRTKAHRSELMQLKSNRAKQLWDASRLRNQRNRKKKGQRTRSSAIDPSSSLLQPTTSFTIRCGDPMATQRGKAPNPSKEKKRATRRTKPAPSSPPKSNASAKDFSIQAPPTPAWDEASAIKERMRHTDQTTAKILHRRRTGTTSQSPYSHRRAKNNSRRNPDFADDSGIDSLVDAMAMLDRAKVSILSASTSSDPMCLLVLK